MSCACQRGLHVSNEDRDKRKTSAHGIAKHPEEQAKDGISTHDMVAAGGLKRRRQRKSDGYWTIGVMNNATVRVR